MSLDQYLKFQEKLIKFDRLMKKDICEKQPF